MINESGILHLFQSIRFTDIKKEDEAYEVNGKLVCKNKVHVLYLLGMEIDCVDGLNNRGFQLNNPKAADTCRSGSSFSA